MVFELRVCLLHYTQNIYKYCSWFNVCSETLCMYSMFLTKITALNIEG